MRIGPHVLAGAALGLGAILLGASGCLTNQCLLTVCDGPYCHCSVSTCSEGAAFDSRIGRCRCLPGRALIGGHCLSQTVADAYCGPGYRFANDGCYPLRCRAGDEMDHATGMCIPHAQVNQVASNMGVNVGAGQKLGCPAGQKLVIDGPSAACVPIAQTCTRDETFDGKECVKVQHTCAEGSAWDEPQAKCVEIAKPSPTAEVVSVDVQKWAVTSYGADGGNGTAAFCNAFVKKPYSFGVNEGSTVGVRVTVTAQFPDGDVAKGTVQTAAVFAGSGAPVPAKGAADVAAAARAALAPLVAQGGHAAAPTATTTVKCVVVNAARPLAVPATGGL